MKRFTAKYSGHCRVCGRAINVGDEIKAGSHARSGKKTYLHVGCNEATEETETRTETPPESVETIEVKREEPQGFKPETPPIPFSDSSSDEPEPAVDPSDPLAVLGKALQPYLASKVDAKQVRDIVTKELGGAMDVLQEMVNKAIAGKAPRVIEIHHPDETKTKIEGAHVAFEDTLRCVQLGRSVGFATWLVGPPGSGKSTIAKQIAEALGLPFYLLTLAPMSPPSALTGYGDANGNYIASDAYKAYTQGGVLCVEEIDNANDGVLTSFNAALANGHGAWPVVGTVEKHPDFVLIACANTAGLGPTRAFPSRRRLDAAFRDRFVFRHIPYDLDLEERLCLSVNPKATAWLVKARMLREWCQANAPEVFVTPRSVMFGAAELQLGNSMRFASESCVFKGVEADLVNRACKGVGL